MNDRGELIARARAGDIYYGDVVFFARPTRFGTHKQTGWMTARSLGQNGHSQWVNGTDPHGRSRAIQSEFITAIHPAGSKQAVMRMQTRPSRPARMQTPTRRQR